VIADHTGRVVRRIAVDRWSVLTPVWSPMGDEIAFIAEDDAHDMHAVWVVRTDGSDLHQVPGTDDPFDVAWAPDGTSLLVSRNLSTRNLFEMRTDGSVIRIFKQRAAGIAWEAACTIVGTPQDDVLVGTEGSDRICGLGGDDTIHGGDGIDTIFGGRGDDAIGGDDGNDVLIGGTGSDLLEGGLGSDTMNADDDAAGDSLVGSAGADVCFGDPGDVRSGCG
jgi:Ca2+-binding RTX toxin-like protein